MSLSPTEQFARDLNKAWYEGRYEDLKRYFHPDVVMSVPGCVQPIVGVDAMLQSYREFTDAVQVHAFTISQLEIYTYDEVEVCHLDFEVDYESDDGRFQEKGRDIYVISERDQDHKHIIWRSQQRIDFGAE